jgi:putative toxin-antitoxin system antitoxin component (TIGR02293 family)
MVTLAQEVRYLRKGLAFSRFVALAERLELSQAALAELLGISETTLLRRRKEGQLTKAESNRLYRMEQVFKLACAVLGKDERALRWFKKPALALGGALPLELADTEAGLSAIEKLLTQLEYGVYP